LKFSPDKYLSKIKIPVLAVNGSLDFQVSAKENLTAIKNSLTIAKNKNFETYEFEGMNHLFKNVRREHFGIRTN
jgi:dipeptidyl aminopeptidase/acylaminoacyl peptidase